MDKFCFSEPSDPTTWALPPRRITGTTHVMDVPAHMGRVVSLTVVGDSVVAQTETGGTIMVPPKASDTRPHRCG